MNTSTLQKPTDEEIFRGRSIRTVARNKDRWLKNAQENARNIKHDLGELWQDAGQGKGISIAAGPSLTQDLVEIKKRTTGLFSKLTGGFEVVAVDAAFGFCLDNGIEPDYVVCTDSSPKILQMLSGNEPTKTKLICNVIADPGIAEAWKGEIYWYIMLSNVYDLDHKAFQQMQHTEATKVSTYLCPGGNVSSVAMSFMLGIRNVDELHLFGHDFCWKDDFYCGGRFKELEAERMKLEGDAGSIEETVDTKGNRVFTNLSLKSFSTWHKENAPSGRVKNFTASTILGL